MDRDQILVGSLIIVFLVLFYCIFCVNVDSYDVDSFNVDSFNVDKFEIINYNSCHRKDYEYPPKSKPKMNSILKSELKVNPYGDNDVCSKKNYDMMRYVKIYNPSDIDDSYERHQSKLLSKNYYTIDEVCPELRFIYDDLKAIQRDVQYVQKDQWMIWPHKSIYNKNPNDKDTSIKTLPDEYSFVEPSTWNMFPFTAFGVVAKHNCTKCLNIWRFLQRIPGLNTALLTRLQPGRRTKLHQEWGSNNLIRCQFTFDVDDIDDDSVDNGCYLSVRDSLQDKEEIRFERPNEWILFDDSRFNYEANPTSKERIALIIDVARPPTIRTGNADVCDPVPSVVSANEPLQIVNYFRHMYKL